MILKCILDSKLSIDGIDERSKNPADYLSGVWFELRAMKQEETNEFAG